MPDDTDQRLDEIDHWYIALPASDQMKWKHPDSIAKHCPKHLLAGGQRGHNQPKRTGKKKPVSTANEERLRAILIAVIQEFVRPKDPQKADELLKEIYPQADFNDSLDDVGIDSDADSDIDSDVDSDDASDSD